MVVATLAGFYLQTSLTVITHAKGSEKVNLMAERPQSLGATARSWIEKGGMCWRNGEGLFNHNLIIHYLYCVRFCYVCFLTTWKPKGCLSSQLPKTLLKFLDNLSLQHQRCGPGKMCSSLEQESIFLLLGFNPGAELHSETSPWTCDQSHETNNQICVAPAQRHARQIEVLTLVKYNEKAFQLRRA